MVVGALGVTAVLFALAYLLGMWAYAYRLQSSHEARLARVLARHQARIRIDVIGNILRVLGILLCVLAVAMAVRGILSLH